MLNMPRGRWPVRGEENARWKGHSKCLLAVVEDCFSTALAALDELGESLEIRIVAANRDRIDEDLFGATIIDYKTGEVTKQATADRRTAGTLQLKIYALAWREMTGALPQRVELRFIESNLVGRHTPDQDDVEEATEAVSTAAAGIRARRFEATPSHNACRYCAYNRICPFTATRE